MLEKYFIIFLIIFLRIKKSSSEIENKYLSPQNIFLQNLSFCNSGQSIEPSKFCDGKIDCVDKSDETDIKCKEYVCPINFFKCKYGGCIQSINVCDGKSDCIDGSEEEECFLSDRINYNVTILKKRQSGCESELQAQCKNGECIERINFCDGIIHCSDGFDETEATCLNKIPCRNGFKCKYGACISKKKSCDGKIDCADKSDESIEYAGCRTETPSTIAPPNITQKCTVPNIENMLMHRIIKKLYNVEALSPGDSIESSINPVHYNCINGYRLREYDFLPDSYINYCLDGSWTKRHPRCTKLCSSKILKGVTFDASCNGMKNDCKLKTEHLPGTVAKLECKPNYIEPSSYNKAIVCEEHGEWDYHPQRCESDCGIVSNILVEYINGGNVTNILDVPWHAAIFYKETEEDDYEYQCGGTIINPFLILSAAHCFWNKTLSLKDRLKDHRKFEIVVGTSARDYKNRSIDSQTFSVKEIIPHENFEDLRHFYLADIALVVLNSPISYNNRATPICIDKNIDTQIETGVSGIIAGWGEIKTNENPEYLHSITLSTLSNYDCRTEAVQNLALDKFCLNTLNSTNITGSHVCFGDSGGGFVQLKKGMKNDERYILRGVLSTGYNDVSCSSNNVAGFTDIYALNYIEFIEKIARNNNQIWYN